MGVTAAALHGDRHGIVGERSQLRDRGRNLLAPDDAALVHGDNERPAGYPGLDLAVSALRTVAGHQDQASLHSGPSVSELKDYALAHLGDPGLCSQAVALAGFVSVRQLHRLFAGESLTFGDWVREQRLRRCRDDLADPRLSYLTVAEIAARWGFRSPAHFTRTFQARYRTAPTSLRPRGQ
jgi:transcriptional regulator GlxA family with amidase domain